MPQFPFRNPVYNTGDGDPPEEWNPPDYAKPIDDSSKEWKPPSYAKATEDKTAKQSVFSKVFEAGKRAWDKVSEPLTEAPTRFAEEVSKYVNPERTTKGVKGIGSAYIEGLGHAVSGLTSPVNLAFAALSGGASAAAKAGVPEIASALNTGSKILSAPVAFEGAKHTFKGLKDNDFTEVVSGALEAGLGTLGMRSRVHGETPKGEPPIRQSREIPYRIEGEIPSAETTKSTRANNLKEYMKKNPNAKMADIMKFVKDVESAKAKPIKQTPNEVALVEPTIRKQATTYMAEERDRIRGTTADVPDNPVARELEAKRQQIQSHPSEFAAGWDPPSYASPVEDISKQSFVNPFLKKTPNIIEGFGGSGHPEDPEYVGKVLSKAGSGEPGLAVEDREGFKHVVYRDKSGEPIAVAKIVTDQSGKSLVQDLAADKSKGLLTGRAMKSIGDKLVELKATESAGTMSPDAENFLSRMKGSTAKKSEWSPPDYAEPQAARTESGKIIIGADIKSLGKILGTSLYKDDIAPIATKELLQNSIDAVRHLGSEGKIDVAFNREDGTIHVQDNGRGLTRRELESVFTDLGASGKREDVEAAGGFGLAKAAPLLGGERVEVKSISKDSYGELHEYSFSGTPNELLEGVDIKYRIPNENESTGTLVKVFVPKNSGFREANDFVKYLTNYSPNIKSQIRIANMSFSGAEPENYYIPTEKGSREILTTLKTPSADVELSTPKDSSYRARSYMELHISNNGMFQKTKPIFFDSDIPNLPKSVIIDIKSKVPEGHPDYPFTANREELRGSVQKKVEQYIQDNIVKPSLGKRKDELTRLYKEMKEITVGKGEFPNTFGHKISIYDPQGKLTSGEMSEITSNPAFHTLAGNIAGTLKEAMKVTGTPEWANRLEKIGIIFEDKLHGIHIPNPESGKSAILVNPFMSIGDMSADEASANILHTILHEMAHVEPSTPGHNEYFTIRLGDIYGKFGARRSVEAQDNILKSIADPNTGVYHPEIQKILQTYKNSRGREATTKDLLSGTGIKSRPKRGKGSIPSSNKPDREGVVRNAVDKLFNVMGKSTEQMVQQEGINKVERARRFAAFAGVKTEGVAGAKQSLSQLRGEFEKVDPEKLLLNPKEADTLFTAVKRAKITEGEKARGYTALFKLLNGESVPQRNELRILDDVFGNGFADKITEMHGGIGAVGLKLSKLANTMKSMQNSISLAAPLRHGIGLIARKEFYPAFADMFKFFANKEYYNTAMQALEERPSYLLSRESGLFMSKSNSLMSSEEEFLNSYAGSIPVAKNLVGASQRAYTGFLNKLRADTFDSMIRQAKELGHEPFTTVGDQMVPSKEAKAISRYINNATGRGSLGSLNKMTNELNLLLWSPRMISSRISMLTNPKMYTDLPKGMRLDGLKSLFGIAALGTAIDTLAAYGGAKVSTNILSTDFGKSRFGTHLIDPWGGFQQYIVGAARFLAGKTDSSKPTSRLEIAGRLLANKESPAASLAHTLLTAKKFTGKSDDPTTAGNMTTQYGQKTSVQREVVQRFTPIFIQDLEDLSTSQPEWSDNIGLSSALGVASLAGMSQDYPEKKSGKLQLRNLKLR